MLIAGTSFNTLPTKQYTTDPNEYMNSNLGTYNHGVYTSVQMQTDKTHPC